MSKPSQIQLRNLNRKEHERTLDDKKFAMKHGNIIINEGNDWEMSSIGQKQTWEPSKSLNQEAHLVVLTEVLALLELLNF